MNPIYDDLCHISNKHTAQIVFCKTLGDLSEKEEAAIRWMRPDLLRHSEADNVTPPHITVAVPVPYLRLHAINEHPVHRVKTGRKRV